MLIGCTPNPVDDAGGASSSAHSIVVHSASEESALSAAATNIIVVKTRIESQPLREYADTTVFTTKMFLELSGAVTDEILLDEIESDSTEHLISPIKQQVFQGTDVQGAFFNYYAGGGFEVAIRMQDSTIIVDRRMTSEGSADDEGGCGKWESLKKYTLSGSTEVRIDSVIAPTDQTIMNCRNWGN